MSMNLCGVDVYLWHLTLPTPPEHFGPFSLLFIANRGTKVYPVAGPSVPSNDWHQCRYISKDEVSDAEVDALIKDLTSSGWRWTKCQKLFEKNGVYLFSDPY